MGAIYVFELVSQYGARVSARFEPAQRASLAL